MPVVRPAKRARRDGTPSVSQLPGSAGRQSSRSIKHLVPTNTNTSNVSNAATEPPKSFHASMSTSRQPSFYSGPQPLTAARPAEAPAGPVMVYVYPYIPLAELVTARDEHGKIQHSFQEVARSVMLSTAPPGQVWDVKNISRAIADRFSYLSLGKGERWEKSLKDALRIHYCFISHARNGSKTLLYSCDATIDPSLKKMTGKRKSLSETPFSPSPSSSGSPVPSRRQQETPTSSRERAVPQMMRSAVSGTKELGDAFNGIEGDPEGLAFEFETSPIFECRLAYRNDEIYYCMRCGPILIHKRRRDGLFAVRPLLRLVRLSFGNQVKSDAAEMLQDIVDEDDLEADLLRRNSANRLAPPSLVEKMAEELGLAGLLAPLLSEDLPSLPDTDPITRKLHPPTRTCRYCQCSFQDGKQLRRHHFFTLGICQLENGDRVGPYLELLNQDLYSDEESTAEEDAIPGMTSGLEREPTALPGELQEAPEDPLPPSSLPPSLLYWTAPEKERLFHALPRCSRWRPDLIAEHVATKTTLEVTSYLNFLDENASLLLEKQHISPSQMPAAREMSEKWLSLEDSLAEDCVVWEAFTEEAGRIPKHLRDIPQKSVMAQETLSCQSLACSRGQCDGIWPTCGRCTRLQRPCEWPAGFHPEALPAAHYGLRNTMLPLFRREDHRDAGVAARDELLESINWCQLSALHADSHFAESLESKWSRAEDPFTVNKLKSRRTVLTALKALELESLSIPRKEAIHLAYRDYLRRTDDDATAKKPVLDIMGTLLQSPEVAAIEQKLERGNILRVRKTIKPHAALWTEIPICKATQARYLKPPAFQDIRDEVQQASKQLALAGITVEDLGAAGKLFHLESIGVLLDLYRSGTEHTAHISNTALEVLYDMVKHHVSQILARAATLREIRCDDIPSVKESTTYLLNAVELIQRRQPSKFETRKHFLESLELRLGSGDPLQPTYISKKGINERDCTKDRSNSPPSETARLLDDIIAEDGSETDESTSATESDEDAEENMYQVELAEEAQIDEADRLQDHLHEEELWELFRHQEEAQAEADGSSDDGDADMELLLNEEEGETDGDGNEDQNLLNEHVGDELGLSDSDAEVVYGSTDARNRSETAGLVSSGDRASSAVDEDMEEADDTDTEAAELVRAGSRPALGFARSGSTRQRYRTKEHISTSDEEDL